MSSIPANHYVTVNPSVISAGGAALDMNAVVLTKSTRPPIGSVLQFPDAVSVENYFGAGTNEALAAQIYFLGFDNSNVKPGKIMFAQKNGANVAAYLRGASMADVTLATLQLMAGTITITVDGVAKTSSTITLSGATSFSNAATLILAGFTSPGFTVTFDSVSSAYVFTSSTTGNSSTITFATGSLAIGLRIRQVDGAVTSQGAAPAGSESKFMDSIVAITTNWVTFMTVYDPDAGSGQNTEKQSFASWANAQNNRFLYVCWDSDASPTTTVPATTSLVSVLTQNGSSATTVIYGTDLTKAAFLCGAIASVDFTETNGRTNFAYRSQQGLTPDVTDATSASNLEANGVNYYGNVSTANQSDQFFYPGSVVGPYKFVDSLINEIWMNNALQLAILTLLRQLKSFPYTQGGYALLRQACADPINAALNFGAIRQGVPLSSLQAAEVNNAAGLAIDKTLSAQGYYLQILPASAATRGTRSSPPCTLWYMDGGSVNKVNLNSVAVQ